MCIFSGHTASFKIGVSKVQDFGNFELSPMHIGHTASFKIGVSKVQDFGNFELSPMHIGQVFYFIISLFICRQFCRCPVDENTVLGKQ